MSDVKYGFNGYSLFKCWWGFAKENPTKIKPIHAAIYAWCVEKNNILNWVDEFQLPTDDACNVLGIGKKDTFLKALKELEQFGAIKIVQEAKNIHTARYISLKQSEMFKRYRPKNRDGSRDGSRDGIGDSNGTKYKHSKQIKNNKQQLQIDGLHEKKCQYFIDEFNKIVGTKYRVIDSVRISLSERLSEGYDSKDIFLAVNAAKNDPDHIKNNFKYLTPEFILRSGNLERFKNMGETDKNSKPKLAI